MLIRVKFYGDVKTYVGKRWTTIEIPDGSNVRYLIKALDIEVEAELSGKLLKGGWIGNLVRVLVNGKHIVHLKGLDTILRDRDLVVMMPVAGGG
jgi:molybdopterin converting factor small subunit